MTNQKRENQFYFVANAQLFDSFESIRDVNHSCNNYTTAIPAHYHRCH